MLMLGARLGSNGLPLFLLAEVALASLLADTPGPTALPLQPAVIAAKNAEPLVAVPSGPGAQQAAPAPVAWVNQTAQQQSGGGVTETPPLLAATRSEQSSLAGVVKPSGDAAAPAEEATAQDLSAHPTAAPMPAALVNITPQDRNGGLTIGTTAGAAVSALPLSASSRQELPSSSRAGPSSGSPAAPLKQVSATMPSDSQPGPALPLQPSSVMANSATEPNQLGPPAISQPPMLQPCTAEAPSAQSIATAAAAALVNVTAQPQSGGAPASSPSAAPRQKLANSVQPEASNASATDSTQQVFAAMPSTSKPGPALPLEPIAESSAKITVQATSAPGSPDLAAPEGRAPAAWAIKSAQKQIIGNSPPKATPLPAVPRQDQSVSTQAAAMATSTAAPIQEAIANVGSLQGATVQQSSSAGSNVTPSADQQQSRGNPSPATALPAARQEHADSSSAAASMNATAAVSQTAPSQEAASAQPVAQMPPAAQQEQGGGSAAPVPMPMRVSAEVAPAQPAPVSAAAAVPEGAQAVATAATPGPAQQLTGGNLAPATPAPPLRPEHSAAVGTAALSGALATSTAASAPQVPATKPVASPAVPQPMQQQSAGTDSPAVPVPVLRHEHTDSLNAPQASDAPPTSTAAPTKHKAVKSDQGLLFILVTLFITIAIICLWHSDQKAKMCGRLQPRRHLTISPAVRRSSQTGARWPPRDID